jgi:pimeloyl-ACP methyl ester carboxylesterase
MGGVIAVEAALLKRDFITHLVLVATSGGIDTEKLGAVDWREEFRRQNPQLPDWFVSFRSDLTSQLKRIEVPVLLLWGDCDPLSPVAVGRCLMNHFPDADLHIVPGGEHDLAHRYAPLIAPLVEAHLARGNPISSV